MDTNPSQKLPPAFQYVSVYDEMGAEQITSIPVIRPRFVTTSPIPSRPRFNHDQPPYWEIYLPFTVTLRPYEKAAIAMGLCVIIPKGFCGIIEGNHKFAYLKDAYVESRVIFPDEPDELVISVIACGTTIPVYLPEGWPICLLQLVPDGELKKNAITPVPPLETKVDNTLNVVKDELKSSMGKLAETLDGVSTKRNKSEPVDSPMQLSDVVDELDIKHH